jgi:hypothetical protein
VPNVAGRGGGGGASFTTLADVTGVENRNGLYGEGGTTTTSGANGGSLGSNLLTVNETVDTLINGGAETGQTTPLAGNWWADTSTGKGAGPGSGPAGPGSIFYPLGYRNPPSPINPILVKSGLISFIGNSTDWGASLVGTTAAAAPGIDGGLFGGGGSGGANSASQNQADMGVPGRGAPGVIVVSWTPIVSDSDTLGISDVVDAGLSGAGNLSDTLMVSDVVDATLIRPAPPAAGPSWLSIGGDSSDSIFPN